MVEPAEETLVIHPPLVDEFRVDDLDTSLGLVGEQALLTQFHFPSYA